MGAGLMFYDVQGDGLKIQVMANAKNHSDSEYNFEKSHSLIRRGDIIGVVGSPCRTKAGELSIAPGIIKLLSPSLHMLPKAHFGFKD
jgi:lysyl-tRNA synthetase class 2